MKVTVVQILKLGSGKQRGLVCRAPDGRFQFAILTRQPDVEGGEAQWAVETPPAALFDRQEDAVAELSKQMPGIALLQDVEPQEIDLPIDAE